jgi:hypothetical protein
MLARPSPLRHNGAAVMSGPFLWLAGVLSDLSSSRYYSPVISVVTSTGKPPVSAILLRWLCRMTPSH